MLSFVAAAIIGVAIGILSGMLGMTVEERPVAFAEVLNGDFVECGLCGTTSVPSLLTNSTLAPPVSST